MNVRSVAGTKSSFTRSPYMDLIEPKMSTGRGIAQEIKLAAKMGNPPETRS